MNNKLKNVIDQYKNDRFETQNLHIRNESFSPGAVLDESLELSSVRNVSLFDLNFISVDFV